jgi:endonuclease/exonuclease/phosphatase family metal-dependent hydrolase
MKASRRMKKKYYFAQAKMKAKNRLNLFDKFLLFLTFLACASLLISYLAPVADPSKYWVIAFFGLAYPILLLFALIFVIYWFVRKSKWVLLPLITIAVGWSVLNKNIGLRSHTRAPMVKDTNTIRIMTYNVHNFKRYGAKNDVSTKHEILEIISSHQPDVLGIQEFYTKKQGQYDMLDSIQKNLNIAYYYFEPFEGNAHESIGMAIFSRFPIVAHGLIPLSDDKTSGNQCLYADIKKNNKIFRVYSVHLQSIRFDPEDYKYLDSVSHRGKTNMGATKRLGSKLKYAFIKRSEQVFKIRQNAADCTYPFIISGDFNDTPSSFSVNQMCKGLKNAFCEKGAGFGRTYNGDFPNYQIDYIMASPGFDVLDYDITQKKLSDHYPVCSDLLLK